MTDEKAIWNNFFRQTLQAEFERRCFAKKLDQYEYWDKVLEWALLIFTPGSGVGVFIAELTKNGYIDIIWKVMLALASVLAIVRPRLLTDKIKSLRSAVQSLSVAVSQFKIVLDDAHYVGINSQEWVQKARKATNEFSSLSLPHEEFGRETLANALTESKSTFEKYQDIAL